MSRKNQRQFEIRKLLANQETITLKELSQYFHVSNETIRKDINELEIQGILTHHHGYIKLSNIREEMPVLLRNQEYETEKIKIIQKAIQQVQDGQIIYLDSGSTCILGIGFLQEKKDITIITSSIFVAYKCALLNLKVILIGGNIANESYRAFGKYALETVDYLHIDVAILGACGYVEGIGFSTLENEYSLKRHIIQQSDQIILVCDHHKFDIHDAKAYCTFQEIDILITDKPMDLPVKKIIL